MERAVLKMPPPRDPFEHIEFYSSGSTLLDLALGGGWAVGRVANVIGDKSVGKTLVAIEGFANFSRKFPGKSMRYVPAEGAFDPPYARKMGFPIDVTSPKDLIETVEQLNDDLVPFLKQKGPSLYVVDSLDALSDDSELLRPMSRGKEVDEDGEVKQGKGSYGAEKAKKMSQLFRRHVTDLEQNDTTFFIISQVRENIGVTFGKKYSRSGGKALDFYASQVLYLAHVNQIERTAKGQKRAVGVTVEAKVDKCKVGNPFRRCRFDIIFGYGIDDEQSMIDWLASSKEIDEATAKNLEKELASLRGQQDRAGLAQYNADIQKLTRDLWAEIEARLAPPMGKYE
jgi:recombination protein RecA